MEIPFIIFLAAAIIPLAVGAIWYGPLFGKYWMNASGVDEEKMKSGNMLVIFWIDILVQLFYCFDYMGCCNSSGWSIPVVFSRSYIYDRRFRCLCPLSVRDG